MKINIENFKEQSEIRFSATVEGDEWKDAQQKAIADLARNVTVKGFRKGKAPLSAAAKYIRANDVMEKAADKAVQKAYNEMLTKNEIKPALQPELIVNEFGADKLSFTFVVVTLPVLELGAYRDITVEKKAVRVLKADVEKELETMANKEAEMVVVEDDVAAEMGNTVSINFTGFVDGEPFDGGAAADYDLELGSNVFIPGFEAQLVGVKNGEDKDVTVQFPEQYVANLSGKEATFKVHVNSVKKKVVPAIDDDFAKNAEIEGVETLEQLKEHLKGVLKTRKTKELEEASLNALLDKVNENATFYCHNKLLENDAERIVKDFVARIEDQGFEYDEYLTMAKKTKEDVKKEALEEAYKNSKRYYVIEAIASAEKLNVTAEELEERVANLAKLYNTDPITLKKQIGDRINSFAQSVRQEKVFNYLKEHNNI